MPMFTAALFTTGNICKQPNCPSADKWIKKMQYTRTHTHTHARAHTHTHTDTTQPLTATWMDLKEPAVYTAQGTLLNTL